MLVKIINEKIIQEENSSNGIVDFLNAIQNYDGITELDAKMVNTLIDRIEVQYNSLISNKINEFKFSAFKNDVSINIIQEKLILEIYKLINDAFNK